MFSYKTVFIYKFIFNQFRKPDCSPFALSLNGFVDCLSWPTKTLFAHKKQPTGVTVFCSNDMMTTPSFLLSATESG